MFYRLAPCATAALLLMSPGIASAQSTPASSASQPLTRSQLSTQLDANFQKLDGNGDKTLSKVEIEAVQGRSIAQAQAVLAKRLEEEFAKLDSDKSGQLSLTEFKAAAPSPKATSADEMLKELDTNKDGKVSGEEYRALPLSNFDRIDTNKDGSISQQERQALRDSGR